MATATMTRKIKYSGGSGDGSDHMDEGSNGDLVGNGVAIAMAAIKAMAFTSKVYCGLSVRAVSPIVMCMILCIEQAVSTAIEQAVSTASDVHNSMYRTSGVYRQSRVWVLLHASRAVSTASV